MIKFPRAEFFDIFGLPTFIFIITTTGWSIITGNPLPKWVLILLFIIGIIGALIDGSIVSKTYLKRG